MLKIWIGSWLFCRVSQPKEMAIKKESTKPILHKHTHTHTYTQIHTHSHVNKDLFRRHFIGGIYFWIKICMSKMILFTWEPISKEGTWGCLLW